MTHTDSKRNVADAKTVDETSNCQIIYQFFGIIWVIGAIFVVFGRYWR